jgi:Zn-dependent peptidase ImmA (M78 family)/DNA-binding XRE family transcriptional regulator
MITTRKRDFHRTIGYRIRMAREALELNQKQLSENIGFKDRQTLSAIENGQRKVSSAELLAFIRALGKDLDYFTDPFRLVGEGVFSWRAQAAPEVLDAFEEQAKTWIAAYRTLGEELGETFSPLVHQLGLTYRSAFEDAWEAAECLNVTWNLGSRPATILPRIAEERLGILILHVDVQDVSISGAACHLPEFNTILVNRREREGRRIFDFAHELFHLLTWQTMPPERIDTGQPAGNKAKRIERLADNFAGALLMPRMAVEGCWNQRSTAEIHGWINRTADAFGVTAKALFSRLRALDMVSPADVMAIDEDRLTWNGRVPNKRNLPALFSKRFMDRILKALDKGLLSESRAARLLDLTSEEMWRVMGLYGLQPADESAIGNDAVTEFP